MARDDLERIQEEVNQLRQTVAKLAELQRTQNSESNAAKLRVSELTVERINVVEADGTLRMMISNKERAPDGVITGKVLIGREGGNEAGIIFYNNEGDECGGLVYSGKRASDGSYSAGGSLTFDQFKQDQVVQIMHEDVDGQRFAGLIIMDRPDIPLDEWAEQCKPVFDLPEGPEKERGLRELRTAGLLGAPRLFMGKSQGNSVIVLRDRRGRPRIRLEVEPEGNPKLEFFDEGGEVVSRLP